MDGGGVELADLAGVVDRAGSVDAELGALAFPATVTTPGPLTLTANKPFTAAAVEWLQPLVLSTRLRLGPT